MPIQHHRVQGDEVRLVTLPRYTRKAVEAWQRFVASETLFGLDVETTAIPSLEGRNKRFNPALALDYYVVPAGLDPNVYKSRGIEPGERRSIRTRAVQFGSKTEGWVLDANDPRWRKHIVALLADESKRFVSHNAAFDAVRVKYAFGVDLGERSIDTLPMANLVWPGRTCPAPGRSKGLKELSILCLEDDGLLKAEKELHARFADLYYAQTVRLPKSFIEGESPCRNCKQAPSWEGSLCGFCEECYLNRGVSQAAIDYGWDHIDLDDPVFLLYAGLDAVYVRRLLDVLGDEIRRRGMASLSRTEQRVKRIMVGTTVRGHRVDMGWTREVMDEVETEFDAAVAEVLDLTGLKVRSPKMRGWLADRGCVTRSLDKDHVPGLLLKHGDDPVLGPVLRGIDVYAKNSNLYSNLQTILRHAEGGNGYTHAQINTLQAHTGRMSVVGPAMQTLAKNGEKGTRLRGCWIARDGHVFVGADYDSQEIRIAADLSGDPLLNRIVAEGLNQHVLTAESIFPAFAGKHESPDEYHKSKTLDFAQQYGAGPKKIALTLGISEAEARDLWLKWRDTYAGLVNWNDAQGEKSRVRNPFGRVIPADPKRRYANGNYLVQSSGRDVLGQALLNLEDAGLGQYIWLPIHDEIVLEVPEDEAEESAVLLGECMSMTMPGRSVPITAEGEIIGTRWRGL